MLRAENVLPTSYESAMSAKHQATQFYREIQSSKTMRAWLKRNRSFRHIIRFGIHFLGSFVLGIFMYEYYQRRYPGYLAAFLFYFYIQGLFVAGWMIHSHEMSHNHVKSRPLNDFIGIFSGILSFVNFYSFQHAHKSHHRNIGNLDSPEAGTPLSILGQQRLRHDDRAKHWLVKLAQKSSILWLFFAWPIFIWYGDYASWLLPFKNKDNSWHKKSLYTFSLWLLLQAIFLIVSPLNYLLFVVIPVFIGGSRIIAITYLHHSIDGAIYFDEKHHDFFSSLLCTTDRDYGLLVNFFMLNNGFHIAHHLNPGIGYFDLKEASAYLRRHKPAELRYHYKDGCHLYKDLRAGLYNQRLNQNPPSYMLRFTQLSR